MKTLDGKFEIYYLFRCDTKHNIKEVEPDKWFDLLDKQGKENYKKLLDDNNLNYDMLIEEFCWDGEEVIESHYIVQKNYLNN